MSTSLVIPTFNRPDDLHRCLRSVARVSPGFDEVIIVDQGDALRTRRMTDRFPRLNITIARHPVPSAAQARNVGIARATGAYLFFVDDDTELAPNYVAAALAAFATQPRAVGLTGPFTPPRTSAAPNRGVVRRALRRCLGLAYIALLDAPIWHRRVLRSGGHSWPRARWWGRHPTELQVLPGGHCVYRRRVFDDGLRFNRDFIRYSYQEDTMFSFQAYKRYGRGSLQWVPDFTLTHHQSAAARDELEVNVRMRVINRFIFWRSEVYAGSLLNLACDVYGQLGVCALLWRLPGCRRRW